MSAQLDALTAQVAANTAAEQSAITLLGVLAAKVAAGDDPAKLQALTDSLKASGDALTAAVTANTPAA